MTKDYRLVPVAALCWLIAWLSVRGIPEAWTGMVLFTLGSCVLIVHQLRSSKMRRSTLTSTGQPAPSKLNGRQSTSGLSISALTWVITTLCLAGAILLIFGADPRIHGRAEIVSYADEGHLATIVGQVTSDPVLSTNAFGAEQWSFTVDAHWASVRGHTVAQPGTLRVTLPSAGTSDFNEALVTYGSMVSATGKLRTLNPVSRAGIALQTVGAVTTVKEPSPLNRIINTVRSDLRALTEPMSAQARALVPGAAIGDTSAMEETLKQDMRVSGLTHITAVSGSHFAILFVALGAIFGRLPKAPRVVILAVLAFIFVLLVHPSPPVLRAAGMAGVVLTAMMSKRPSQAVSALSLTVIVLILYDPFNAYDIGFALSVAATASIVCVSRPLARWLHQPLPNLRFLPKKIAFLVAVPLTAQCATAPLLALIQPFFGPYALLANLAVIPVVAPTALLALVAAVCAGWWHGAASFAATVASGGTWWIAQVAQVVAEAPGAQVLWPQGPIGAGLLVGAMALVSALIRGALFLVSRKREVTIAAFLAGNKGGRWLRGTQSLRLSSNFTMAYASNSRILKWTMWTGMLVGVWAVCLMIAPSWVQRVIRGPESTDTWDVVACDVGQGDAFLVAGESDQIYMVDVGPPRSGVIQCLKDKHIDEVSVLFLSHFHADHVGALREVLGAIKVGQIITGPPIGTPETITHVQNLAREFQVPVMSASASSGANVDVVASESASESVDASVSENSSAESEPVEGNRAMHDWQILWPTRAESTRLANAVRVGEDLTNDASLVVLFPRVRSGTSAVFLGDLEESGQSRLARHISQRDDLQPIGIAKLAHHGSASQSARLARELAPDLTIVGVGASNSYGHPAKHALDLYSSKGHPILRTDQCGTFEVSQLAREWFVVGDCP